MLVKSHTLTNFTGESSFVRAECIYLEISFSSVIDYTANSYSFAVCPMASLMRGLKSYDKGHKCLPSLKCEEKIMTDGVSATMATP